MNRAHRLLLVAALSVPCGRTAVAADLSAVTHQSDGRASPRMLLGAGGGGKVTWATAEDFLRARHADFDLPADLSNLRLLAAHGSLLGTHYRYQQVLNGLDVEGGEIVVSLRPDGQAFQVFNNIFPAAAAVPAKARLTEEEALDRAWNHLRVHGRLMALPQATALYVPGEGGFHLVYRTLISTEAPFGHWEHRIDALTGKILSVRLAAVPRKPVALPDYAAYAGPILPRAEATSSWLALQAAKAAAPREPTATITGSGQVFDPDPRCTLANAGLLDSSAASVFTAAYFTRPLQGITSNAGVCALTGPWVNIAEVESPTDPPSTTAGGVWTANRGTNAFNDVMSYFHIDQNQRYLQSLGFTNVQHGSITVDSDGVNGDDNSWYVSSDNHLAFGHGGVDDNEDADVILHEYGHAITYSIVPTWGGGDTRAIGEGFGDYWGASYSYVQPNGSTFHPPWAFTWDGHGADTWTGRFLDMTNLTYDPSHTYTDHETIGGIANYSDQLWGTPIFQAFQTLMQLGYARTNIDRIMIQSLYGIGGSPKMRDMAYAIVNTASNLYPTGPYASIFFDKFLKQSILPQPALATPSVLYPAGGEIFLTGDTIRVNWNRSSAPAPAAARLDFAASTNVSATFQDAVESGTNGWTRSHASGSLDWATVTTTSHSPTHAWFSTDQTVVSDQYLVSPTLSVAAGDVLSFWHRYSLERGFDGGVVEISTNGGTSWSDLGALSSQNGYNGTISTGYSSPIGGRQAFTDTSAGFVETRIPLSVSSASVKIRFRTATDSSDALTGWWVDDVAIVHDVAWTNFAAAVSNAASVWWKLPANPTTSAVIRIQQFASGYSNSSWATSPPFTISPDTDGDGLPDAWEVRYFTNLAYATSSTDRDGDGVTDRDEYRSGTSPMDSSALLRLVAPPAASGSVAVVRWASVSNRTYTVLYSTNLLQGFVEMAANVEATPPENAQTNSLPAASSERFFRIRSP